METFNIQSNKIKLSFVKLGGRITSITCADRNGKHENVVLSPVNLMQGNPYYGAIIGRVANRICEGKFTLNGKSYNLDINNSPNHLHGGPKGFHNQEWEIKSIKPDQAVLVYTSKDGEENYPGNVKTEVTYTLVDHDFIIELKAITDQPTPINLTHHCFFNLAGEGEGDILDHSLMISADHYTPLDQYQIPKGEIKSVANSPFDFTKAKRIGENIESNHEQIRYGQGYDHNFVITNNGEALSKAAKVEELLSGRTLEVFSNAPCMQFYTGNFMDGTETGQSGRTYKRRTAFCLEPQHFPDAVNQPAFPSVILEPGHIYDQKIIYRFGVV
ncbi:galactose-1-epimerase [Chryseotalea sanaruensis]|uniref:Aldose 1-epimerase n=2 Tax=Chryseotalea sanaruensis TaxID=2482724 RepID=A0A401U503_9BACT|nr:galactose-1-epimerase [Chryseotalea sanaruensis]